MVHKFITTDYTDSADDTDTEEFSQNIREIRGIRDTYAYKLVLEQSF